MAGRNDALRAAGHCVVAGAIGFGLHPVDANAVSAKLSIGSMRPGMARWWLPSGWEHSVEEAKKSLLLNIAGHSAASNGDGGKRVSDGLRAGMTLPLVGSETFWAVVKASSIATAAANDLRLPDVVQGLAVKWRAAGVKVSAAAIAELKDSEAEAERILTERWEAVLHLAEAFDRSTLVANQRICTLAECPIKPRAVLYLDERQVVRVANTG